MKEKSPPCIRFLHKTFIICHLTLFYTTAKKCTRKHDACVIRAFNFLLSLIPLSLPFLFYLFCCPYLFIHCWLPHLLSSCWKNFHLSFVKVEHVNQKQQRQPLFQAGSALPPPPPVFLFLFVLYSGPSLIQISPMFFS